MSNETYISAEMISCRPSSQWWSIIGLAFFFFANGLLVLILPSTPPPANPAAQTLFFGIVCAGGFVAGIMMLWWMLHAQILADSEGLRWRGLGGWRSVRWDQVSDYYGKLPMRTQPGSAAVHRAISSVVETPAGKLRVAPLWNDADALRALISLYAIGSRAQQWEIKGTRSIDPWPRVFDYDTRENRWAPRIWFKLFSAYVFYLLIQPALKLTAMVGGIGWAMTLTTAALYLLLMGSLGLIFLLPLAQYRSANRRKTERITVDPSGIVFESETQRVEALWPEVTGYHIVNSQALLVQYAVETQNGSFEFLPSIRNAALLKEIIQHFAKASADQQWRSRVDMEVLGGEAARWSSRQIGIGSRVYHYRNRMNRAVLWMPLLSCLLCGLLAVLTWQGLLPQGNAGAALLGAGACALTALLGYSAYRICRIECDDEGLTQITLLGTHRLRWSQIENYFLTKERNGVMIGRDKRVRFSPQIAGCDELKAEITSKAECGGKAWEQAAAKTVREGRRRGGIMPK